MNKTEIPTPSIIRFVNGEYILLILTVSEEDYIEGLHPIQKKTVVVQDSSGQLMEKSIYTPWMEYGIGMVRIDKTNILTSLPLCREGIIKYYQTIHQFSQPNIPEPQSKNIH